MPQAILVSACLLGINCRYNSEIKAVPEVINLFHDKNLIPIPICPEQLGGLSTPRPKVSFSIGAGADVIKGSGRLTSEFGDETTSAFIHGAEQSLSVAKLTKAKTAILKERSPSCGVKSVYQNNTLINGEGVTAALLTKNGLELLSEEDIIEGNFSFISSFQ